MPTARTYSPPQALALLHRGLTVREVARELGCHRATVYSLLRKARDAEIAEGPPEHLTPVNLGIYSRCNHQHAPMAPGDPYYCVTCHQTGWDWHPKLQARPLPKDRKRYSKGKLKGGTT